jgi:dTDP-4-dehydrorhamnose 3,5-epimerase
MKFISLPLDGAYVVELEQKYDDRGYFARGFCSKEFGDYDLPSNFVQMNNSFSTKKGTIRGMHYQENPAMESKLVRCVRGSIWDVIIDMRPDSLTYLDYYEIELSEKNQLSLFIPPMFAHGNQTLCDDTELLYLTGDYYTPACERGVCPFDPSLAIKWPLQVSSISKKDSSWPLLNLNRY